MGAVVYKEETAGASGRLRPTGGGVRRKGGDDAAGRGSKSPAKGVEEAGDQ